MAMTTMTTGARGSRYIRTLPTMNERDAYENLVDKGGDKNDDDDDDDDDDHDDDHDEWWMMMIMIMRKTMETWERENWGRHFVAE